MAWGANEQAMIPDMAETAAEMLDAAGARNIRPFIVPDRVPGYGIHDSAWHGWAPTLARRCSTSSSSRTTLTTCS